MTKHIAVWIDHKEARIFRIAPDGVDETIIAAPLHNIHHKHPRGYAGEKEHPEDAKRFFQDVARALDGAEELLIVGPSTAKLELIRYVHQHERAIEARIVGIETVDHPTDGQLLAYAKKYFKRVNATTGSPSVR